MKCRSGCGACCIAPSISTPLPGMPNGKPSGVRCVHLDEYFQCLLWQSPLRPHVCTSLMPSEEMCGTSREEAFDYLIRLEELTLPELLPKK